MVNKINKMITIDPELLGLVEIELKPTGGKISGLVEHLLINWIEERKRIKALSDKLKEGGSKH